MHITANIALRSLTSFNLVEADIVGEVIVDESADECGYTRSESIRLCTATVGGVTLNLSDDEDGEWFLFASAYRLDEISTDYDPFTRRLEAMLRVCGVPTDDDYCSPGDA